MAYGPLEWTWPRIPRAPEPVPTNAARQRCIALEPDDLDKLSGSADLVLEKKEGTIDLWWLETIMMADDGRGMVVN